MKTKYNKRKCKNKRKSIFLRKNRNRNRNKKTRKILRGGVVMPFSETAGIFGNISRSLNNLIGTVHLSPVLPTPTIHNQLLTIDPASTSENDLIFTDINPSTSLAESF